MEGDPVHEVDAQDQREAEDQHEGDGGPPVGAKPPLPFVHDAINLREVAPMRERLYIACSEFHRGRAASRRDGPTRAFWDGPWRLTRDGLKTPACLPASDEAGSHGDLVLPRLQGRSRADRRCGEGRDPRGLPVLQELQSSVRDQGRDPGPASPRFQMNSACAATTPVLSFADM